MVRSDAPHGDPWRRQAGPRDPREARTRTDQSSTTKETRKIPRCCRAKGKLYDQSVCPYNQGLACCICVSHSRRPATALTAGRPPSYDQLGEDGLERVRDTNMGVCRMVTGRVRRRPCQARHGCMYVYVIYVECSRSWQTPHRCASLHPGSTPPCAFAAERRDGDRTGWTMTTPGWHGLLTHTIISISYNNAMSLWRCQAK